MRGQRINADVDERRDHDDRAQRVRGRGGQSHADDDRDRHSEQQCDLATIARHVDHEPAEKRAEAGREQHLHDDADGREYSRELRSGERAIGEALEEALSDGR